MQDAWLQPKTTGITPQIIHAGNGPLTHADFDDVFGERLRARCLDTNLARAVDVKGRLGALDRRPPLEVSRVDGGVPECHRECGDMAAGRW